jgi:hypothetical protein
MTTLSFTVGGDDFAPTLTFGGNIAAAIYTVYSPALDGGISFEGTISATVPRPKPLVPMAGQISLQGTLKASLRIPYAAFKDFAHYPFGGIDPAMAMLGATSGSLTSAASGSYNRQYAVVTAPQDYPVSGGGYAWKKAAYASVGFKFASMNANGLKLLDAVLLETAPLGASLPSAYSMARQIQVIIKPSRLNYATNPNMESGITGYSSVSGATLAADAFCWRGTQALKVTAPSSGTLDSGTSLQVTGLIPGRTYTLSARVSVAQSCGEISPWVDNTTSVQLSTTAYTHAPADPTNGRWRVVTVTFTALAQTTNVGLNVVRSTMTAGVPSIFWADGILIEEGSSARPYFDGNGGPDYLWEAGGTVNQARSYYYENRVERGYLVQTLLNENTPLGISSAVPLYAVLPTQ